MLFQELLQVLQVPRPVEARYDLHARLQARSTKAHLISSSFNVHNLTLIVLV